MRFLFVQWRYHTNRHPMVKALQEGGHEVKYLSQFANPEMENYSAIEPVVVGYSPVFEFLAKVTGRSDSGDRMKFGWAPVRTLWREMKDFEPDVVIVRNYGIPQALALGLGNLLGASGIIQEQHPKFKSHIFRIKTTLDSYYGKIWGEPLVRITPILGNSHSGKTTSNVYYVPFSIDLDAHRPLGKSTFFNNNQVNLISIGKFSSERKNHLGLLRAFRELSRKYELSLTLVGHLENTDHPQYLKICSFIETHDLQDSVDIKINVQYADVQKMYKQHDVFVLPSRDEPAAVSPVEAMAAGLPVICSDTNGTRGYITPDENGYIFETGSQESLRDALEMVVTDREKLQQMSKAAVRQVECNHLPRQYRERMESIVQENFNKS